MKEKLTISEMAKLRGVTSETLRHYDRIGLFKPYYVDQTTGYRYYSIFQYEVLGTIKELREIGMSTEEIKTYLDERNLSNSLSILEKKHLELIERLKDLRDLEKSIEEKIKWMKEISEPKKLMEIVEKNLPSRNLITQHQKVKTNVELCYGVIALENNLRERAPIFASNRLGVLIDKEDLVNHGYQAPSIIFITERVKSQITEQQIISIPEGKYVCIRYSGELWDREVCLKKAIKYIEKMNYEVAGYTLQIAQVDITVTDVIQELVFEIQIPILTSPQINT
ncbi:MerR family transcriptional regulator [Bacillales bacterium AN1005]